MREFVGGGNCVTAYARQRNSATAPEGSDNVADAVARAAGGGLRAIPAPLTILRAEPPAPVRPERDRRGRPDPIEPQAPVIRLALSVLRPHPRLPPCTGGATPGDKPPHRGDRCGAPPPWRLRGRGGHLLVHTSRLRGDTTSHVNARARAPDGAGGRSDAHRTRATRTLPQRDPAPLAARWRLLDGERGANSTGRGAGACRKAAPPWAAPQSPTRGLPWHGHTLVLTGWLPALGRSAGAALPPFNTRRW